MFRGLAVLCDPCASKVGGEGKGGKCRGWWVGCQRVFEHLAVLRDPCASKVGGEGKGGGFCGWWSECQRV